MIVAAAKGNTGEQGTSAGEHHSVSASRGRYHLGLVRYANNLQRDDGKNKTQITRYWIVRGARQAEADITAADIRFVHNRDESGFLQPEDTQYRLFQTNENY